MSFSIFTESYKQHPCLPLNTLITLEANPVPLAVIAQLSPLLNFANVINFRISRWNYYGLRVEPKFSDVCPRKRWKKEKHRDPGMKVTWTEAETAEMQPQAQECWGQPAARHGQILPQSLQKELTLPAPWFRLLASGAMRGDPAGTLSPPVCGPVLKQA